MKIDKNIPIELRTNGGVEERFWAKVDKSGDCWEWTACKTQDGYGRFNIDGIIMNAHRAALLLEGVDIPSGMCVCHTCDNPKCVKPDHLFLGSHRDNMADAAKKKRLGWQNQNGESSPVAVLCDVDVLLIRELAKTQTFSHIARWLNMNPSHISQICKRKIWKHI